ncbi:hypothetical protein [Fundidesulfovibrio soli]|uniref:hypothetical protein n=1 Tax=Fundidesulfovibrio soli TaxID=2922716 RepID=UPI001FAFF53E|nr:hypothetical protein [Fundidesulfovibrio soli]
MRSFLAACLVLGLAGAACAQSGDAIIGGAASAHGYRLYGNDGTYRGRIESGKIYGADGTYRGRIESGAIYGGDGTRQDSLRLGGRGPGQSGPSGQQPGRLTPAMGR